MAVPQQVTDELTQILSNLVLGDNLIRASAEAAVNDRLARAPDLYVLALAQFAVSESTTSIMRTFSLVLLRRLLFRPTSSPSSSSTDTTPTLRDHLAASSTLPHIESMILKSLLVEKESSVRRNLADLVVELARAALMRGTPWIALQITTFRMVDPTYTPLTHLAPSLFSSVPNLDNALQTVDGPPLRASAFTIWAGCVELLGDLNLPEAIRVLKTGLADPSPEVRSASLLTTTTYIAHLPPTLSTAQDTLTHPLVVSLLHPMFSLLPPLKDAGERGDVKGWVGWRGCLEVLTGLAGTHPTYFIPILPTLLPLLHSLLTSLPKPTSSTSASASRSSLHPDDDSDDIDPGPTPTASRPGAFIWPPPPHLGAPSPSTSNNPSSNNAKTPTRLTPSYKPPLSSELTEAHLDAHKSTLEFMLTLLESKPHLLGRHLLAEGWVAAMVRGALEGMGRVGEDEDEEGWGDEDPSNPTSLPSSSEPYEQTLDRLALALSPSKSMSKRLLAIAFQQDWIPGMMKSPDWHMRYAGLMAVGALAEGTAQVMQKELGLIVELVVPLFRDPHPKVRWAACQCIGQLCTDLEEIIQNQYHQQLFNALIPTLEDREPRVQTHAAAALINFCEGVSREILLPYLDPIVERLLAMLNAPDAKRYAQEQAITTLAMVADASETTFAKHYHAIMPLLMNALNKADGPEYRKLRLKAMECAGLIAIAVGREVFVEEDRRAFVSALVRIQNLPPDPEDALLGHYLIATWAKICQALGVEFEPYLHIVMPPLLRAASAKADISVYDEDEQHEDEKEGWDSITMDGQRIGIKTSAFEEKCQAFETLVIYVSTLSGKFAPYLEQTLELVLPAFKFYVHDGVREACAMITPMLLSCGKQAGSLTHEIINATFIQVIKCIMTEADSSFLASLFKCLNDCLRVIGGPGNLPPDLAANLVPVANQQMTIIAERRKARQKMLQADIEEEKEDLMLLEEMEEFALEEMEKLVKFFDPNHGLIIAISSVKELGLHLDEWSGSDSEDN